MTTTATRSDAAPDAGDPADRLLPLLYDELRRLARAQLNQECAGITLEPTSLVHEVYLKLAHRQDEIFDDRTVFLACASRTMRRLLIDHARRRQAAKRRASGRRVALTDLAFETDEGRDDYLVALDEALHELAGVDEQLARLVELRFFGGLTIDDTAEALGVSPATVKRMWSLARGWLHRAIREPPPEHPPEHPPGHPPETSSDPPAHAS